MFKRQKIAYLGGPGSYSYLACVRKFPDATHMPYSTFAHAFRAIQSGDCDFGLIPIENAIAGRVADVHQLLPGSGLYITGELYLPIEHCLLGLPGADLDGLRAVHSHVQALGQCRSFIARHALTTHAAPDTSSGATVVATSGDTSQCAIAGRDAAKIHGLEIIQENIEDFANNVTRFVVLSRDKASQSDPFDHPITTMSFDLGRNPGKLHCVLSSFAENAINITRIESYISRETFASSSFMIDFEGTQDQAGVKRTFSELKKYANAVQLFGTYESARGTGPATQMAFQPALEAHHSAL